MFASWNTKARNFFRFYESSKNTKARLNRKEKKTTIKKQSHENTAFKARTKARKAQKHQTMVVITHLAQTNTYLDNAGCEDR